MNSRKKKNEKEFTHGRGTKNKDHVSQLKILLECPNHKIIKRKNGKKT
jgi:hypothetical protein